MGALFTSRARFLGFVQLVILATSLVTSWGLRAEPVKAAPLLRFMETPYRGGKDRYDNRSAIDSLIKVTGKFLEVPLDHARPERGTFDLFYRVSDNFDAKLPSVIFFNGGPGGSSDMMAIEKKIKGFNLIYFDQRGTSFSHLRTQEDMINPENFSSEATAHDAEALRKHLGIAQVSVLGHSYGTIPATIYGSLFPESTRAVVIEGVVFDGTVDLWRSPYRLKVMQKFYDRLSDQAKATIRAINESGQVPLHWLSQILRSAMYESNFDRLVEKKISDLTAMPLNDAILRVKQSLSQSLFYADNSFFGTYVLAQISCQELSMSNPESGWDADLVDGQFRAKGNLEFETVCREIPGMDKRTNRTYFATNYPILKPVTYFEGSTDGATVAPNAMRHYKEVAKGRAQLVFEVNGGHSPTMHCLGYEDPSADKNACPKESFIAEALQKALLGENISAELLKNMSTENRWAKGSRFRSKIPQ